MSALFTHWVSGPTENVGLWRRLRRARQLNAVGSIDSDQRGAVLVFLAASTLLFLLAGAIAVDLSIVTARGQRLQNAADAAALAAVVVYADSDGDQEAARSTALDLIAQNGIALDGSITAEVSFPDGLHSAEVEVSLTDTKPPVFFADVTGVLSTVDRSATARFEKCDASCTQQVRIPPPFTTVEVEGEGDGYKPVPVGENKVYALNHNASPGRIACVDRVAHQPCWTGTAGAHRRAHTRLSGSSSTPEMPHAAVVGTKLYWTASDPNGTALHCWETTTDTPCSGSFELNTRREGSYSDIYNRKDKERGGGTVAFDDKVYAFTDDHRVHCFDPAAGDGCAGYGGGRLDGLGSNGIPINRRDYANTGSSIDRVVDADTGRIYATLHIKTAEATGALDPSSCSTGLQDPRGHIVLIQNVVTGDYIYDDEWYDVEVEDRPADRASRWIVRQEEWDRTVTFKNVKSNRSLDSDSFGSDVDTSASLSKDDQWVITNRGSGMAIVSDVFGGYLTDRGGSSDLNARAYSSRSQWRFLPYQCGDPSAPDYPPKPTTLDYQAGTWLHCWDTIAAEPCQGFEPSAIHNNGDRFSGRLFFYTEPRSRDDLPPRIVGVCSSGFDGPLTPANFEIRCVDVTGTSSPSMTGHLDGWARNPTSGIRSTITSPLWAWGDPHWNEQQNRLYYPSARGRSRIFCWDFDDQAACGTRRGSTPLGYTQDYGFYSDGACVYGLGHKSIVWSFAAADIFDECTDSSASTTLTPCRCGGDWAWGKLEFEVDLRQIDELWVQIHDATGALVYPLTAGSPGHSLVHDGLEIDLSHLPIDDPQLDTLTITTRMEYSDQSAAQDGDQHFLVTFGRLPRLTN